MERENLVQPPKTYVNRALKDIETAVADLKVERDKARTDSRAPLREHVLGFANRHGLIIYGGSALNQYIKIYEDYEVSDVDMYSSKPECHARKLAAELVDDLELNYVEARESRVHDLTFGVKSMELGEIADVSYMSPENSRMVMRMQAPERFPYVPYEYILFGFHREFAQVARNIFRWNKVFPRFVRLLEEHPFRYSTESFSRHPAAGGGPKYDLAARMIKALYEQDVTPRLLVGAHAVAVMCHALGHELAEAVADVADASGRLEILCNNPEADARVIEQMTAGGRIRVASRPPDAEPGAKDEGPLRELVLTFPDDGIDLVLIQVKHCYHYVDNPYYSSGSAMSWRSPYDHLPHVGGLHTLQMLAFNRLIYPGSTAESSEPGGGGGGGGDRDRDETQRGLIGVAYDLDFNTKTKKKQELKGMQRSFEGKRCLGGELSYNELIKEKFEQGRSIRAYWPWLETERLKRAQNKERFDC
jgi:hypothetical protein